MSFQNELIIQIMTESHEIDSLKRKIEDAKMKLLTEIKVLSTKINQFVKPLCNLWQNYSSSSITFEYPHHHNLLE